MSTARTRLASFALVAIAAAAFAVGADPKDAGHADHPIPKDGVAVLTPTKGNTVNGVIQLSERDGHVHITGEVRDLSPGKHGFHIHQFGDLRAPDGTSAGPHYAEEGEKHGGPGDHGHHAGDLGNIEANDEGVAKVDIEADWLKLHFVIGRSLVVHAKADDLKTQPSGNSGDRVAVGVIGFAQVSESKTAGAR